MAIPEARKTHCKKLGKPYKASVAVFHEGLPKLHKYVMDSVSMEEVLPQPPHPYKDAGEQTHVFTCFELRYGNEELYDQI